MGTADSPFRHGRMTDYAHARHGQTWMSKGNADRLAEIHGKRLNGEMVGNEDTM
jgi:hypothetical protein